MECGLNSSTSKHHNNIIERPTSLPGLTSGINDQFNNLNISPEANNIFSHKPIRIDYENVSPRNLSPHELIIDGSEHKWGFPRIQESVTKDQTSDSNMDKLMLKSPKIQTSENLLPGSNMEKLVFKSISHSGYSSSQSSPRSDCVSPLNIMPSFKVDEAEIIDNSEGNIDKIEEFEKHSSSIVKVLIDSNESNESNESNYSNCNSSSDESEDSYCQIKNSNNVNLNSHSYIKELNTGHSESLICEINNNIISRSLSPPLRSPSPPPIPPRTPNPPALPPKSPTPPALPPRNPGPPRLSLGPKPKRSSSLGTSTMLSPKTQKILQESSRRHSYTPFTKKPEEAPSSPGTKIQLRSSKGKRTSASQGQESLMGPSLLGIDDLVQISPNPQIEISIEAQNLGVRDVLHKSCPRCVVFLQNSMGEYLELEQGRTEIIMNNNSEHWITKVIVPQRPYQRQYLKFAIYDWVLLSSEKLIDQVKLGQVYCEMQDIVNMEGLPLKKNVLDGKGSLKISCEVMSPTKEMFNLQFAGTGLEKMDIMSNSDPFIIIYRASRKSGNYIPVFKTKVIMNNCNPVWEEFRISSQLLANGDYSRSIKIECYDWDSDRKKKVIGECFTNINLLLKGPVEANIYQLLRRRKNGEYKESGKLELRKFETEWRSSFIDYIRCGTTLHFVVGVDFSSHIMRRNSMDQNSIQDQYITAMWALQSVFRNFGRGQSIQAFGFHNEPNSVFTLGPSNLSVCSSVSELIDGYKRERRKGSRKPGRINLGPILHQVNDSAEKNQDGQHYILLLIITGPGRIDLPSTNASIVSASQLPLSISIMGVGEPSSGEDFKNHRKLHREPVVHGFKYEDRKIVRFVEMSEHQQAHQDWEHKFVEDLLEDVPEQLVSWMRMKNLHQGILNNS